LCEDAGITLVVEPLNILVNHKGYYLATSAEGFQILDEVGSPHVQLLFDIYHQQITEGNLIQNITRNIRKIGHFHVADVPGRHQPGTGEINYGNVFAAIVKAGYTGFIGLEMWPTIDHATAVRQTLELFHAG
jgi:hydroxypyruvate isomerase